MNKFMIARPKSLDEASSLVTRRTEIIGLTVLKAGGMDLVDHMKEGLLEPKRLVDVMRIDDASLDTIDDQRIGARATLAEITSSDAVKHAAPVIAQACASAATPQVRNVATAAGNLLQRPRCWYYRNKQFDCLKKGGDTCFAASGENENHAIFGGGPCHIVHPSNLAIGLAVCDAMVQIHREENDLPLLHLFNTPQDHVEREHNLKPGQVVTGVSYKSKPHSGFYAIKQKQSFDWPIVMVGAALEMDGDRISSANICAGAVAPTPWPLPEVAKRLAGVRVGDDAALREACDHASDGARPMSDNGHKQQLLNVAVRRAVRRAAGLEVL